MSPQEYRDAITALGLNQSQAGRFFGVHPATGRRWASDLAPPASVAKFLRLMLAMNLSPDQVDLVIKGAANEVSTQPENTAR